MERNKLETQFKEQLDSREIKPSEMAWNKLDAMLMVAEKPKAKFPWMYIAASILGFLFIGTVYFNQKNDAIKNQKKEVVIQDAVTPKSTVTTAIVVNPKIEEEKSVVINVVQKTTSKINKITKLKEESIIINKSSNQNQVAEVSISNQKTEQKSIKPQTNTVSVDVLLAAVENPSKREKQLNQKPVVHVNASNLLLQVDGELELSFREKIINKVSKNYQTVKVALSNRNLE
ncbi:hypothetical protein [Flavobacterium sp. AED]|uniref:hypothetical protein n=1 Tax=Flavobacterium sp. AED TaxID=1423323 RepID=UPI00057EE65E|nr:hypothetical protein [Flavobacterium sp. AED]KIA87426.1 hypothetical protein OA85_07510 [Flavobacterium sp. AED]MDI1306690.1 hypothetical protein [bacterium]